MSQFESVSYTLRLVYDDLKSRLSQFSQNVTSLDHLMYSEYQLKDDSPFSKISDHYGKIFAIQDRIQGEIGHIKTQLSKFYSERNSDENDQSKKVWINSATHNLKDELEETINRLSSLQKNFIQSHKSKIFDVERQIDPSAGEQNNEIHHKIDLYRKCLSRCETQMYQNRQYIEEMNHLISSNNEPTSPFDNIDISQTVRVTREQTYNQNQIIYEKLTREQHLLVIICIAVTLALIVTVTLMTSS